MPLHWVPLVDAYDSAVARGDDLRLPFRRLHVVLDVLDRPYGAQSNHEHVLRQRLQRLRGGGALEAMWREAPVAPRRANPRHRERDDALSPAELSAQIAQRRGIRLVHAGERRWIAQASLAASRQEMC